MALVVTGTCFLALMYVAFLPFIGKRAQKKEEVKCVYPEHFPYEETQIAYNRMHGLPDDAI